MCNTYACEECLSLPDKMQTLRDSLILLYKHFSLCSFLYKKTDKDHTLEGNVHENNKDGKTHQN